MKDANEFRKELREAVKELQKPTPSRTGMTLDAIEMMIEGELARLRMATAARRVEVAQEAAATAYRDITAGLEEDYASGWKTAPLVEDAYNRITRHLEEARKEIIEFCDFDPFRGE